MLLVRMNKVAAWIIGVGWLISLIAAGYVGKKVWEGEEVVRTDTVWVDRTITKRDTVTKTVPQTVRVFDTVETVDTMRVAVPQDYRFLGTIERRPIDITDDEVTLTYQSGGQYRQNVYDIPQQRNRVSLFGETFFLPGANGVIGGVSYTRDLDWARISLEPGYGITEYGRGLMGRARLSIGYSF